MVATVVAKDIDTYIADIFVKLRNGRCPNRIKKTSTSEIIKCSQNRGINNYIQQLQPLTTMGRLLS